jgi:two-component system cell cycle sensor histidine kinase PleC
MPSEKPLAKRRRLAAQRVREARDRLTSTTGTRVAFDYELLRQFAENRLSASLVILLLVGTVGFLSSLWIGAVVAGAWTAAVLVIHAIIVTKCRQFLSESPNNQDLKRWRVRFIALDLFYGLAWMYNLIHPLGQDQGSSTFMLFVMLLVVAVSSMLASSLPIAVFAATVPVTFAVALNFALQGDLHNYILGIMAVAAQGYFTLLAHRRGRRLLRARRRQRNRQRRDAELPARGAALSPGMRGETWRGVLSPVRPLRKGSGGPP